VIAAVHDDRVKSLVYIAALAPDEGETVADVFYRAAPQSSENVIAGGGEANGASNFASPYEFYLEE
jgi:hypothetical protein